MFPGLSSPQQFVPISTTALPKSANWLNKGVKWLRAEDVNALIIVIFRIAIAILISIVLVCSLIGMPLLIAGAVEWVRQQKARLPISPTLNKPSVPATNPSNPFPSEPTNAEQAPSSSASELQNSGKYVGKLFFNRRKVLVSYTKEKGWQTRKLNNFQLIARKYFGFYKSTRLEYLYKKCETTNEEEKSEDYQNYIRSHWKKKNILALGNSKVSEGNIFCFAESHTDESYRTFIAQFINEHYQEGDVVLVEGLASNEQIEPKDHQSTRKLNSSCIVRGWEPKNFKELTASYFNESREKYKELLECAKYFEENVKSKTTFSEEELETIESKIKEFSDKINQLNTYYKSKSKTVLNSYKILSACLEEIKKGTLHEPGIVLQYVSLKILTKLEQEQTKAFHANMSQDKLKQVLEKVRIRNDSLAEQIKKWSETGHRVFVIGGASHFLNFPSPWIDCKNVQETLNDSQFIILTRKITFSKRIAKLNSSLESFDLDE